MITVCAAADHEALKVHLRRWNRATLLRGYQLAGRRVIEVSDCRRCHTTLHRTVPRRWWGRRG